MGEVFIARTPWEERPVAALKRLRPDVARVPTFAERFQHEAELAVRLGHSNVVATLDVGSVDEQLYVASQLILGKDIGLIADRLRERGQGGPAAVALRILIDALAGLAYVHGVSEPDGKRLQLVHRDITPGNLLVGYEGVALLADFGLAKSLLTEKSKLTQHGEILGTPHYLPPEVIHGEGASTESDLYGIGAVIYRFLTGVAPHQGTTTEVLLKVLQEEPRPLSELRPDLPPWLVSFVHRLLEKDRSRRPSDAARLAEQLIQDAKAAGMLVSREQVGQWLVSLFEVEYAEEVDEYERIAAIEPDKVGAKAAGTVVLARSEEESRLHMPTPEAFLEYERTGGTNVDLSAMSPSVDLDAEEDLPTQAVTVLKNGELSFEDGTEIDRTDELSEREFASIAVSDPALGHEEAETLHRAQDPENVEPSTQELLRTLPGFVDGHQGRSGRSESYDPGITSPDPPGEAELEVQPRTSPRPNSVVVRAVEGSNPAQEAFSAEGSESGSGQSSSGRPRRAPGTPRAPAQERHRANARPEREAKRDARSSGARSPGRRPPIQKPRGEHSERSRDAVEFTSAVLERASSAGPRSRNLVMAGGLFLGAVALGVGIGAVVATVKGPREIVAPAQSESQALAQRFIDLKHRMDERARSGEALPAEVERLATDAATALLQKERGLARRYLDEMERLLDGSR